ncbi:hexokinase-3 isoform X3 [Halyomorpha halys]|uniref:hexokinase-3 isoform X3 n=1 Tax=Halyomorpha halys TaxID=286706 RepID=UPI0034D33E06
MLHVNIDCRTTEMPELIDIETAIKSQYITQLKLSDSGKEKKVKEVLSCLVLTRDKIVTLANLFSDLLLKGLQYDGTSPFNMQNTFIYQGLEGNESGSFLALDLGGTNYRVVLVELKNGSIVREEVSHYDVPEHLRVGSGPDLFDFFAKSLADFTEKHGISSQKLPLGFTFSFPTDQYALDSAFLQKWAGKYNVSGVVGQDVVKLLNEAISKISGLDVSVVAVVNDTTGALMRGSLIDNEAAIGLILGTGSNACYFEKTKNIPGWKGKQNEVMLNIEWGTFSDDGRTDIIKTKYDDLIDKESLHPNLFTDNIKDSTKNTRRIIVDELGIHWCSDDDISTLKYICEIVSIRMGLLTSIGLSEIIKRMQRKRITVACDGSLHKYHPRLSNYIIDFTSALINYKTEIKLIPAYDGSGVGAALIAAIACKQK